MMQDRKKMLNEESTFPEIWSAMDIVERSALRETLNKETGVAMSTIWRWANGKTFPLNDFQRKKVCAITERTLRMKFNPILMWQYVEKTNVRGKD